MTSLRNYSWIHQRLTLNSDDLMFLTWIRKIQCIRFNLRFGVKKSASKCSRINKKTCMWYLYKHKFSVVPCGLDSTRQKQKKAIFYVHYRWNNLPLVCLIFEIQTNRWIYFITSIRNEWSCIRHFKSLLHSQINFTREYFYMH